MAKNKSIPKGYVKITPGQLAAICNAGDLLSGMVGGIDADANSEFTKVVKLIDRFLDSNGLKRNYK